MTWLKSMWSAMSVAVLAALAVFAMASAQRHKSSAKKWQEAAVDGAAKGVKAGTVSAAAANSQAKLHDAKAHEIRKKAEERLNQIGKQNEDMADILDRWRRPS